MANEVAKRDSLDESADDLITMMMTMMMVLVLVGMLPAAMSAQQYYQTQMYQGLTESVTLTASSTQQSYEPATPWVSAYVVNDGPSPAYVGANKPSGMSKLYAGEATNLNFLGAERRIDVLFYRTDSGTATLRVKGQY